MAFSVTATVRGDASSSVVSAAGTEKHQMTGREKQTFGAEKAAVKSMIGQMDFFTKKPTNVFYNDPTPWGDQFQKQGWQPVTVTLEPTAAKVTGTSVDNRALIKQTYRNQTDQTQQYSATLTKSKTTTESRSWSNERTVSVSQSIEYGVEYKGISVGGETEMSYEETWGRSGTHSEEVSIGSEASVSVSVPPHSKRIAVLSSNNGTLNAKVTYQATLGGQVFANFGSGEKGHHYWGPYVSQIYGSSEHSRTREITEEIEIGYWSNTQITVKKPNDEVVAVEPLYPAHRGRVLGATEPIDVTDDAVAADATSTDGEAATPDAAE